jgi:hypothetical protein
MVVGEVTLAVASVGLDLVSGGLHEVRGDEPGPAAPRCRAFVPVVA